MLVRIVSNDISFGCMKAQKYNDGESVCVLLYESIDSMHTSFVPSKDDLVWCNYYHSSVFLPVARINEGNLCMRMNPKLPTDILVHYFPLMYWT